LRIGLFLGCNMPALRPDTEKAIRVSLKTLGVEIVDLEGAACCPAYGTFWSADEDAALAVCAWNYSIAEKLGVDMIVQCGSCYSTLRVGRHKLLNGKLKEINERFLSKVGMKYEGKSTTKHITDFMFNDIGVDKIRESLKFSMEGLTAVVQIPCHTIRPSEILGFDDPENPKVLKELTRALGAEVPTFTRDKQCCGGAGGFARHNRRAAMEFLKLKLDSMKEEVDPDCIVVSCITCLMWMDEAQEEMRKLGMIDYKIPVFDYNQLLAICQGHDPSKVSRIAATPRDEVIKKILENKL